MCVQLPVSSFSVNQLRLTEPDSMIYGIPPLVKLKGWSSRLSVRGTRGKQRLECLVPPVDHLNADR